MLDTAGILRAQHDSYPANGAAPMTGWIPAAPVFDPHTLELDGVSPGEYTVAVKLYTWQDGQILHTSNGEDYAVLGTVQIK